MDASEIGVQMGLVAEEVERLGHDDLEAFNRAMADRLPGLHKAPDFPSVDWLRFAITSLQYVQGRARPQRSPRMTNAISLDDISPSPLPSFPPMQDIAPLDEAQRAP